MNCLMIFSTTIRVYISLHFYEHNVHILAYFYNTFNFVLCTKKKCSIFVFLYLQNAQQLSVLSIQNNIIDDVLQIENLKCLSNPFYLNTDNNEFLKTNIDQQILSNNLHPKLIIDQSFEKMEDLQVLFINICVNRVYKSCITCTARPQCVFFYSHSSLCLQLVSNINYFWVLRS